jgi:hypothetical protein
MNCRDVDRALIELEESPAISFPPEAQEHVRSCRRCQGFVDALNISIDPGSASPATLRQIERAMVADFLPVRPVAPAARRFAVFGGIFGCFVAFGVYRMGAFAIAVMSPLQACAILSALAISAGLMAYSLANQMVPGSPHRIPPRPLAGGILISLPVAIVLLFQFQHEADFWTGNWACISAGTPFSVLAAIPLWLVLRRGAVLSPRMTGAATGLLAGLVGTSVLEIHCPNLDAGHILVAHLGVSLLCATAGFLIGLAVEIIGRRLFDRPARGDVNPFGA